MMAALKSELRKLLSVRSTYYILGICLFALLLFAFYGNGIKANSQALSNPGHLADQATQAINALAGLIGLVGLLLVTHEFRYNTIVYTLTASKNRTQVLLAKVLAVTLFSVVVTLAVSILSPLFAAIGIKFAGNHLTHQVINVPTLLWHCLFFGWGMAMTALAMAMIIRNQVGALVAFLFIPGPGEAILGILLKQNAVYLPFSALNQVISSPTTSQGGPNTGHLSPGKAVAVFSFYLITAWLVAWYLFHKRDAA